MSYILFKESLINSNGDEETSILVGLLTMAIGAGISITTKTSLVTQVNKAVGGKTGATINYYTRDLNIALRYLPCVSAVVLGSLAAQAAFSWWCYR
jgi:hypothetical protein